jgi:hypothetical protein
MKKILLLFSIIICCRATYAQTLTVSPASVTSGGTITVKASGESLSSNIYNLGGNFLSLSVAAPNQGYTSDINGSVVSGSISYYNTGTTAPTTFQFKPTSSAPVPVVVTYTIVAYTQDLMHGGSTPQMVNLTFKVTITPPSTPTVFYNVAKSQVFYNNTCAAGYSSDPYTYTVAAHTYSSTVSQADADSKAQAVINANGQNTANANAPCKVLYYSSAQSASFTRNNCSENGVGSSVVYSVPAGKYSSTVSQADADSKAQNDIAGNGQNYANANGTCTLQPYILESGNQAQGQQEQFEVYNTSPGDTFVWSVPSNIGTIVVGQNSSIMEVALKRLSGTQPYPYKVTLTITNAGVSKVIYLNTQSKYCPTCPID